MTYSNRVYVSWDKYYESPEIQVFSKDILFVKTGSTIGKVAIAEVVPEPMTINPQLVVIKEIKNHPNFLNYVMNSNSYQFQIMGLIAGGSTPSMTQENLGQTRIIAPPLEEQKTIAAFLDRKTAEIDELIAQKERLIALYEEEKTAIINEAVTKGINPDVKLKPTAIDWLGDIPEHWEVKRLKFISPVQSVGVVVNPSNYIDEQGEIPFIYGSNISPYKIDFENSRKITKESNNILHKSQLVSGDLVVVRVGEPGVSAVIPDEIETCNCASVMFVRRHERFSSHWLCHLFNSPKGRFQVKLVEYGAAQKQFNIDHAVNFQFPFPPLEEQKAIAEYIEKETARIDTKIAKTKRIIELQKEYRTALISEAVTGKIKIPDLTELDQ
jgi:type I restriction enzyme S subunit